MGYLRHRIDRHGDALDAAAIRDRLRILALARDGLPEGSPAAALAWERDALALLEAPDRAADGDAEGGER
jgi:hypothetical protein